MLFKGRVRTSIESIWPTDAVSDTRAGKGIIILLSGPPGVGKTLTAESGMCPP